MPGGRASKFPCGKAGGLSQKQEAPAEVEQRTAVEEEPPERLRRGGPWASFAWDAKGELLQG